MRGPAEASVREGETSGMMMISCGDEVSTVVIMTTVGEKGGATVVMMTTVEETVLTLRL